MEITVEYLNDAVKFSKRCIGCKEDHAVELTSEQFRKLQNGQHIQNVLPNITPDTRELFISGFCGKCFDNMFAGMDE